MVLEENLERVEQQVRQITAKARQEKEMVQMVQGNGSGFRNDLLVVSQPERGRSGRIDNGSRVVDSFYDALVDDGSIPMNSCGLARGGHPSAKRARSLTTQALVRAGSQEKRAHSVDVVAMD